MADEIKQAVVKEIQTVFDEMGYKYDLYAEKSAFEIGFSLDASINQTKIFLFVEDTYFIALATTPLIVSKNINSIYEYIARINYGLLNGNFEINPENGEIRYKVYVNFDDKIPPKTAIVDSLVVPVSMMEKYIDGALSVMTGAVKPETAVVTANQIVKQKKDEC